MWVYSNKPRLYTEVNNKQLRCLHRCCTVKIQKLVTNVSVLRGSGGTAVWKVPNEGTLGCFVPRPCAWEFIEGRCLCRLAILSFLHVTQHRKLSMFSSHLFPGMHLWYDFSGHTFQIAWYVQCKSEILFWYGIHTTVFAVLYFYTLG